MSKVSLSLESCYIEEGLAFLISHFSKPLFPRMVSTAATNKRQYKVDSNEKAVLYFQGALWEDCRISGYGLNQTNPDLIFIELDRQDFASLRSFKLALTTTLKNIKEKIGGYPSVIWSGHGYHIIQPIFCPIPLEQIKEIADLEFNTSTKFLQFAERYLSDNKHDKGHHPALKSCLLRIPWSINSKCKSEGLDPEVKIIQRWNGYRPDYRLLIGSFYAYLVQQIIDEKAQKHQGNKKRLAFAAKAGLFKNASSSMDWIDKLLQTGVDDGRKRLIFWVLAPYLIIVKRLDYDKAYNILEAWLQKCDDVKSLNPGWSYFRSRIGDCLDIVADQQRKPIKLQTFKEYYPNIYKQLSNGNV